MQTVTQRAVPVQALRLAKKGDPRALLAIPEARLDLPRLIEGKARGRYAPGLPATEFGSRKAVAAAKSLIADREARRAARAVAEKARGAVAGTFVAKARKRLESFVTGRVGDMLDRNYRCATSSWAGGETTNVVTLSDQPGASSGTYTECSKNGKWSGQSLTRRLNVSPRWKTEVLGRQLAVVDGMLTTHAARLDSPEGVELYRATWVRQSRGMSIESESGIIARHTASGTTYHLAGDDAKKAVAGLKRKMTAQGVPADVRHARAQAAAANRAATRASQVAKLVGHLKAWDLAEIEHVVVRREHSIKAGNCAPGTDEFIDRFFPDRGRDSQATIGELAMRVGATDLAKLSSIDLELARQIAAAALVAIRRDKQARRAFAIA